MPAHPQHTDLQLAPVEYTLVVTAVPVLHGFTVTTLHRCPPYALALQLYAYARKAVKGGVST